MSLAKERQFSSYWSGMVRYSIHNMQSCLDTSVELQLLIWWIWSRKEGTSLTWVMQEAVPLGWKERYHCLLKMVAIVMAV